MSIFKRIFSWIRDLFQSIPSELKEKAQIALTITNIVKQAIDSPWVRIAVQLTKTPMDDVRRTQVSNCLHAISAWLGGSTIDDIAHILKGMSSKHRNAVLSKMASDITACLDGNEQKESLYDAVVQNVYTHGKLQDSDTANA